MADGTRRCAVCCESFVPRRADQLYCSKSCKQRRWREVHHGHDVARKRKYRIQNPEAWNDRRKAAYHRRRARKRGVVAERVSSVAVFERDRWVCQLCKQRVRQSLVYPDPLSASLDHIVPLAKGGGHVASNVQLAHLRCNLRKNDRAAGEQLRLIG